MNKILIIQTASLGDVILSTALAESLHQRFPECSIDMLVKKGYEQLFQGHPFINEVRIWDKKNEKYRNLFRLVKGIRGKKYDAVVNVQRHFSSGLITALSGSPIRSGFRKNPLSFLFTHRSEHLISAGANSEHEVDRNFRLLSALGSCSKLPPRLYPAVDAAHKVKTHGTGEYITISPASLWFTKQWPENQWIRFISELPAGIFVYLLGAKADETLCQNIRNQALHTGIEILAGKLSFLESAALMKGARMNFVNDSAPLHLASATNSPVTAVFCSTVPGFGFGPLSDDSRVIETKIKLECRPCGLHGHSRCPEAHFKCAETIENAELLSRIS
jgi:heptosyltransferase II